MRTSVVLATLAALSACAPEQTVAPLAPGQTGADLTVDYFGDTDVVGFHFEITRVACDAADVFEPSTVIGNVDLVDGIFPGMISLVEQTLDPSSRHLGADFFLTLEPGCYDVLAVPAAVIDGTDWVASADCASTMAESLEVVAGLTTEATLLSQCVGDPLGALDVLVLLNHPPQLTLEIDEKFNYECEPVTVCATLTDPDDDPLEVVWTNLSAEPWWSIDIGEPQVVGFEDGHRIWEACADIVTQQVTSYDILVQAFDLAADGSRIEDLVAPELSRAELVFPIHTNWIEEPLCFDDDGDLVPVEGVDIERAEGCSWVDAETYYCSGQYAIDPAIAAFLCDGTELVEEALYPECGGDTPDEVCDGADNDGDGEIDEGFVTGFEYAWSEVAPGGSSGGGTIDESSSVYNAVAQTWSFETSLTHGVTPSDAFTIAISDGPNPKGTGHLALAYVDCTGGATEPTVTVYAYNGLNTFTSYQDGSSASGIQAPDAIANSQADPGLLLSGSCTDDGTTLTVALTLDVAGINAHTPLYPAAWAWAGIQHDTGFGIWHHPWAGSSFTYDADGWITNASYTSQGWHDASNLVAAATEVCLPE